MAKYHVRADGSMGVCHAKEGNCPFGGEEGTRHFTSKADAIAYSEKVAAQAAKGKGSLRSGGLGGGKPPVPPVKSAAAGDDWPRYDGDFSKWNGVPATNHWRDVPGIDNDPSSPSTKVRAYVMDKMVDAGFGDGAKGNDLTYDGVGYFGASGEVATDYVGDSTHDSSVKAIKPESFGSITNPSDTTGQDIESGVFNKSYHGMSLSNDGKTLVVNEMNESFAYEIDDRDDNSDNKQVAKSNKDLRTFRETMKVHGVAGAVNESGDFSSVTYKIDATDPKAIDNYFEAYRDFKSKIGEDAWKKGYYGNSD